jgi:hypothetical protein
MLILNKTPVFTAAQQVSTKMPKGEYGIVARGFHCPGTLAAAMKDYANGENKAKVYITLNNKSQLIKHIAEGGDKTKLVQGGNEALYSGLYVPANNAAYKAYMDAGRYDNLLKMELTTKRVIAIGFKQAQSIENDLLVLDGFKLFYYGDPTVSDINELETDTPSDEVEGYYNLNGMRLAQPGHGITIVKYKNGKSEKINR